MGNSRAFVACSVWSAAARRDTSGRSRPIAVVKNGPLRVGVGQRAAVKSGDVAFERTDRPLQDADNRVARAVNGHRTAEH